MDEPAVAAVPALSQRSRPGRLRPLVQVTRISASPTSILQGFPTSFAARHHRHRLGPGHRLSLGIWAALRQNSVVDYATMGVFVLGIAVPNFVVAPVLTLVFGLILHWLPVADGVIRRTTCCR